MLIESLQYHPIPVWILECPASLIPKPIVTWNRLVTVFDHAVDCCLPFGPAIEWSVQCFSAPLCPGREPLVSIPVRYTIRDKFAHSCLWDCMMAQKVIH